MENPFSISLFLHFLYFTISRHTCILHVSEYLVILVNHFSYVIKNWCFAPIYLNIILGIYCTLVIRLPLPIVEEYISLQRKIITLCDIDHAPISSTIYIILYKVLAEWVLVMVQAHFVYFIEYSSNNKHWDLWAGQYFSSRWPLVTFKYYTRIALLNVISIQMPCWWGKGSQIKKIHGANMGPTWVLSAPYGPHVSPMNHAIRGGLCWLNQALVIFSMVVSVPLGQLYDWNI